MTEVEEKKYLLQRSVNRARTQMPSHIVLRVFKEPKKLKKCWEGCVETWSRLHYLTDGESRFDLILYKLQSTLYTRPD